MQPPPVATARVCDRKDSPQLLQTAMRETKCFQKREKRWLDSQNYYNSTALKAIQEGTSHKHCTPSRDNVIQSVYDGIGLKISVTNL